MRASGEVPAIVYEEQLFNEPFETFYEILTSPAPTGKGAGKSTKILKGGMVSSVGERTALIPIQNRPGSSYSIETENQLIDQLKKAIAEVKKLSEEEGESNREKEALLAELKAAVA